MHRGELFLLLCVFAVRSASRKCIFRPQRHALEGEPFYLTHCGRASAVHKNETAAIRWFRVLASNGYVELNTESSPRITLWSHYLEFWPVELEDNGTYFSLVGNDRRNWTLTVIKRNEHSCFSEELLKNRYVEVKKSFCIKCNNSNYDELINNISLYKIISFRNVKDCNENTAFTDLKCFNLPLKTQNCKEIKPPEIKKDADFEDEGYYSCVYSVHHNGKQYNITETFNITVTEENSKMTPAILGRKFDTVEVDLGEEVELNCTALLNKNDLFYWSVRKEDRSNPNVHEDTNMTTWTSEGKLHAFKKLRIRNVAKTNLNVLYNCTVTNEEATDTKSFMLVRKKMADIPSHVFTRGIIVAVFISVAVVCVVILCVIYKVDLVLFYRRLTERDETLTDGKTYDAFVSYLKECHPENGEEHTFAVETLPRVLEKQFGYKLCIFERDVVPGGAVIDEIQSLIEKSRRLIIVLSKSYLTNETRLELESGLHEALVERKIKLILIEFTPAGSFTVLPPSLKLLKPCRVLKWQADKSLPYNSRFWKNLLYLMPAKAVKPWRGESEALPVLATP